jgi:hypothetical protein
MVGSVVGLLPYCITAAASCLALALVFHHDIQLWGSGSLRFRCDLTHHCAKVSHQQLSAADLAFPDRSINCPESHSLET